MKLLHYFRSSYRLSLKQKHQIFRHSSNPSAFQREEIEKEELKHKKNQPGQRSWTALKYEEDFKKIIKYLKISLSKNPSDTDGAQAEVGIQTMNIPGFSSRGKNQPAQGASDTETQGRAGQRPFPTQTQKYQ